MLGKEKRSTFVFNQILNKQNISSEINGILVCYKTDSITVTKRPAPPTPTKDTESPVTNNIQQQIDRLKLYPDPKNINNQNGNPIPPPRNKRISSIETEDEYEIISPGYQLSPNRPAPPAPNGNTPQNGYPDLNNDTSIPYDTHTLYYASAAEMLGVPFKVNSLIKKDSPIMVSDNF